MSASNYSENRILDYLLGNGSPATVYISLHTGDPGETGANSEVSGNNYSRLAITNNSTNWPAASGGLKSNGTVFTFAVPSGSWGTVTHYAIWDAASAGNCLLSNALDQGEAITTGATVRFAVGALDITCD